MSERLSQASFKRAIEDYQAAKKAVAEAVQDLDPKQVNVRNTIELCAGSDFLVKLTGNVVAVRYELPNGKYRYKERVTYVDTFMGMQRPGEFRVPADPFSPRYPEDVTFNEELAVLRPAEWSPEVTSLPDLVFDIDSIVPYATTRDMEIAQRTFDMFRSVQLGGIAVGSHH